MRERRFPVQVRMLCICHGVAGEGLPTFSLCGLCIPLCTCGAEGCPWGPRVPLGCVTVALLCAARLVQHTKDLMETEEKLCIKVLRTLQQMLVKRNKYGERVSTVAPWHVPSPTPQRRLPELAAPSPSQPVGAQPCSALALALGAS